MFFNYPNNPTGAVVRPGFFAEAVDFARTHEILAVHDNAYSETTYDGYRAPSFLATPGAKEVGVEVFSWSKGYNMTGWRCAAIVGNADAIAAYWKLKTNIDSGLFEAVQLAGIAALQGANDGSYVVAWQSNGQDSDNWGVFAQRYDHDGAPFNGQFVVNPTILGQVVMIGAHLELAVQEGVAQHRLVYDASGQPVENENLDVNPAYGTIADFRSFVREAHRRGLKVITELVINHTSDQHPWFQRARRARLAATSSAKLIDDATAMMSLRGTATSPDRSTRWPPGWNGRSARSAFHVRSTSGGTAKTSWRGVSAPASRREATAWGGNFCEPSPASGGGAKSP